MGYTTDFTGRFSLDKPLTLIHHKYLSAFADIRHMARDPEKITKADPIRTAAKLPIGKQGAYFVGNASEDRGQAKSADIVDFNTPPEGVPGLWCDWAPDDLGLAIEWNGQEKFYDYQEWLQYIIDNFLGPWGYKLNGNVKWQGEDPADKGTISVVNNKIKMLNAHGLSDKEDDLLVSGLEALVKQVSKNGLGDKETTKGHKTAVLKFLRHAIDERRNV